jgi:hypothetical protein
VQFLDALKPLAHGIAEGGLVWEAVSQNGTYQAEAHALGALFSGHALKRLHLRGLKGFRTIHIFQGFLAALATALPALESLGLSHAEVHQANGESLQAQSHAASPSALPHLPVVWQ